MCVYMCDVAAMGHDLHKLHARRAYEMSRHTEKLAPHMQITARVSSRANHCSSILTRKSLLK